MQESLVKTSRHTAATRTMTINDDNDDGYDDNSDHDEDDNDDASTMSK